MLKSVSPRRKKKGEKGKAIGCRKVKKEKADELCKKVVHSKETKVIGGMRAWGGDWRGCILRRQRKLEVGSIPKGKRRFQSGRTGHKRVNSKTNHYLNQEGGARARELVGRSGK